VRVVHGSLTLLQEAAAAGGEQARGHVEMQWVRDAHEAYHARYAKLLQAEAAATREAAEARAAAEAAAARLRGEAESVASMELGELTALESELWQSLQRVSRAKTDAMHAGFERRLQARRLSLSLKYAQLAQAPAALTVPREAQEMDE